MDALDARGVPVRRVRPRTCLRDRGVDPRRHRGEPPRALPRAAGRVADRAGHRGRRMARLRARPHRIRGPDERGSARVACRMNRPEHLRPTSERTFTTMRILILGGDGYLGWPTAMHFSRGGPRGARRRQLPPPPRPRGGRHRHPRPRSSTRSPRARTPGRRSPARRSASPRATSTDWATDRAPVPDLPARGDRPLRRDAVGAVVDDRPRARRVHAAQQRRQHAERPVRDARARARLAPREARDDGRVRHAEHRHRGGLPRDRAQRAEGDAASSRSSPGADVPPVEGPRLATTSTSPAGCGASAPPT